MKTKTPKQSHRLSFAKTVTWRILASADTFLLSWLLTGAISIAMSIASLEVLTKMFLYYWHERAWATHYSKVFKN
jgi:uncharacterized membrane protein